MSLLLNVVSQASGKWLHQYPCPTNTNSTFITYLKNSDSTVREGWQTNDLKIRSTSYT